MTSMKELDDDEHCPHRPTTRPRYILYSTYTEYFHNPLKDTSSDLNEDCREIKRCQSNLSNKNETFLSDSFNLRSS